MSSGSSYPIVAILDADKEGYLRSSTSLIQTIGRASRHIHGKVIMYANVVTNSMKQAIDETERRREMQKAFNNENGITPTGIHKEIRDINERIKETIETNSGPSVSSDDLPKEDLIRLIKDLESQMRKASKQLEFEKAALLRDQVMDLRKVLIK